MTTDDLLDHDDLGEALAEGRELRPARAYRFKYAHGDLNFRPVAVVDPVPLGRQILAAGGDEPNAGCSVFAILANGDFE
ncbi:MAG: multiubiquitin domain-containing protein, partial [Terricaulis sp.]